MLNCLHKAAHAAPPIAKRRRVLLTRPGPPGRSARGCVLAVSRGERLFPPSHVWNLCRAALYRLLPALFWAFLLAESAAAAPPGAIISNTATVEFINAANQPEQVSSNSVEVIAAVVRSASTIELTRIVTGGGDYQETVGPSACLLGNNVVPLDNPTIVGGIAIDPSTVQEISPSSFYNIGEPVFVRLADSDQNVDYQAIDTADVTLSNDTSGDRVTVRLSETGADTGIFAGFVPTAGGEVANGDCVLQAGANSILDVSYEDPADSSDLSQAEAALDPVQRAFESRTGTSISGVTIEIVDAATGLPAIVYGNDGISQFPSAIVTGGSTTDSSGTSYVFGPGEFRFPVVPDGDYRFIVTPPSEYSAPSTEAPEDLQNLPGAPFDLAPASFSQTFTKAGGLSVAFDIPVDPRADALFLQKRTLTTRAAPGDFIRYELTLENASVTGAATDVTVVDTLPMALRFVSGSVVIDGSKADDPLLGEDGRTLEFDLGSLNVAETVTVAYVTEVLAGEAGSQVVNRARATAGGGLVSNEANVAIRLEEDLFRSTGTIIGRVLEGDCSADTFTEEQGVAGVRIYLEDGRYAVSDDGGRFHFEGLPAGTHVAQLDTFSVPDWFDVVGCDDTPGFSGRADSQFVRLQRGSLLRADFYLRRKPAPEGRVEAELVSRGTDSAEQAGYDLTINGVGNVPIEDIEVMIMLPDGVAYTPGSMRVDGEDLGDPRVSGPVVSLALPDRSGNWTTSIEFVADIASHVSGELTTKALARFDTPIADGQQTPIAETIMVREPSVVENTGYVLGLNFAVISAELTPLDKTKLDTLIDDWRGVQDIQISAVGHSDSQPIRANRRHLFADNYSLSEARARAAAAYVADALGLPAGSLQVAGRGPDEPVADNATAAGREQNRRVEMVMTGVRPSRPSFLEVTKASSGAQTAPTRGAVPGTELADRDDEDEREIPNTEPPIDSLTPGTAMLLPARGFMPPVPAAKVSIQHDPSHRVAVYVNRVPVNAVNFDTIETNAAANIAVSRWKGVELKDGANEIRAVVTDPSGNVVETFLRSVYYSGHPIRGEIVPERSKLIADGKTRPVVAVRLFDRSGQPSREGMVGAFRVNDPYRAWWEVENDRRNQLVAVSDREPTYRIGADGVALLELEPTTRTGEVKLQLKFENYREQEIRAWLEPADRDWILVGFAEGTAGYNTLSDNAAAAEESGNEDGYYDDGRVAFFAKGQIKGEFLLTLAYDSERDREANLDAFNTVVDPNRYYPLYADTAEQRFEAASQRKLYVKLERNQFYALFGDFETGLTVTDLSRYQRQFNGLLSEYRGENAGFTMFAAESSQAFNRDEIRGDGTSGLYQLSNAPIITNSEEIRLEVRDRFDSGVVLETTVLRRFLDYNLDTLNGTLFFKKPVPNRDLNFNPVYIIAEYESRTSAEDDVIAGGRGSLRTSDDRFEIGITRVDDQTQGAEAELTGADLRWQINDQTLLTAEIAETTSVVGADENNGRAHSVEIEHNGEKLDVRAFMREVEDSFGLGYQAAADSGVRRLGIDARAQVGERVFIEGEAGWQQNLETSDIRNLASGRVRYERSGFTGSMGVTHASDEFDDGESRTSDLAEIGLSQQIFGGRMVVRANGSTALSADAESADYPNRVVVGADYRIMNGVDLVAEYEKAEGRNIDATMSRLGVRATPWSRAQIDTSVNNQMTEFGPRLFANVGLVQGFQLNERWILDVGVDQTRTLLDEDARRFDDDRELPSGSLDEDFLSVYTGATYNAAVWSANSRIEYRDSDSEQRASLLLGWYREPVAGHGLSAGLTVFQGEADTGREMVNADLRLGWAYREANRRWSFLDRLDLIFDDMNGGGLQERSWRIINNFNANRRIGAVAQLSLQYASKYVRSNFDGASYSGYTDLIGIDLRRGFGRRFEAGINTSIYHSWESDVVDYGLGIDVGFNLATNIWISLGYNLAGFEDDDFRAARYTAAGPFLRFSIKADQHTLKSIAGQR